MGESGEKKITDVRGDQAGAAAVVRRIGLSKWGGKAASGASRLPLDLALATETAVFHSMAYTPARPVRSGIEPLSVSPPGAIVAVEVPFELP